MNMQTIAEHSVAVDLLDGGICIDVGCRGFQFSEAMRDLGCEVHAYDIEDLDVPVGIKFGKLAILDRDGIAYFKDTKDKQAKHISEWGIEVRCAHINYLLELFATEKDKEIDVLKLDCEGSEYIILTAWDYKVLPRQLSIEFHEHAHKHLHDLFFNTCMENLLKYYTPVQHERYAAHGAGMNYWDSLFVRRDLL